MDEYLRIGQTLGLEGNELRQFVLSQQEIAREERRLAREAEKEKEEREREREEREREEREREREFELEKLKLGHRNQSNDAQQPFVSSSNSKPKLQSFIDGRDQIDAYLSRFERFARTQGWPEEEWATSLSVLLSGRALEVYARMREEEAEDYSSLKSALLLRYDLTEEGYRKRLRESQPELDESPAQFITRLREYLNKWIELSGANGSADSIVDLMVSEQFLNTCSSELATYLRLKPTRDLEELAKSAENFLNANGRRSLAHDGGTRSSGRRNGPTSFRSVRDQDNKSGGPSASYKRGSDSRDTDTHRRYEVTCYSCGKKGHKSNGCTQKAEARQKPQNVTDNVKCFRCNRFGHYAKDCRSAAPINAGVGVDHGSESSDENQGRKKVVGCAMQETRWEGHGNRDSNVQLELKSGELLTVIKSGCTTDPKISRDDYSSSVKMPVVTGYIGEQKVKVLRDTGCSGVIVKRKFVEESQYTGKKQFILRVDNTLIETPTVRVDIDSPYFTGVTEAQCLGDAIFDVIIGNVKGARNPEDPLLDWQRKERGCSIEAAPALRIPEFDRSLQVNKEGLVKMQKDDPSLAKYYDKSDTVVRGKSEYSFSVTDGVLYRHYKRTDRSGTRTWQQILLPRQLRSTVMRVAHESLMGGHQGVNKTLRKVESGFFWPGVSSDVTRYCQSCDICQKTAQKCLRRAPLAKMPVIDVPFRRVAVDLIGPISPETEEGYKYILTFVDYATRYPEAIPLKDGTTESVADALFTIYCRLGVPEQLLSDLGTQFISECMEQVSALMGIRRLTTSVSHPEGNGLVERFNKTLRSMIRKLCSEEPNSWCKYLDALLFACREAPQDSMGFSPFEMLYGRTVRGPLQILKELWTNEKVEPDVKMSYQYVFELRERLEETLQLAHDALEKSQAKQKVHYDRRSKMRSLAVGQEVLIMLPTTENKLLMQWRGPYLIVGKVGQYDYRILVNGVEKTYHVNLLKKYNRRSETSHHQEGNAEHEDIISGSATESEYIVEEGDDESQEGLIEFPFLKGKESIKDVKLGEDLTSDERKELVQILESHEDIFTDVPGKCNLIEHKIPLQNEEIVQSKPYPIPYGIRDSVETDVKTMLDLGIIRPSESPYASPMVVVRKRDNTNRICIDFRKLNKATISDSEPMPQLNDMFQDLAEDNYFTKIDLSKGYWQIPMADEDIPKTAFVLHNSKFEFLRMPFGLKTAGGTLMKGMRKMLQGMKNVHNYIDDILIHTKTWEEHVTVLRDVLKRLKEAGLSARPSKSEFGLAKVEFLGHDVGQGIVQPNKRNLEKVSEKGRPRTKKEVRSLVALAGFYREYIPNFATLVAHFTDLTKKKMPNNIVWNQRLEASFDKLKCSLLSNPVLKLPEIGKEFVLRTDASNVGIGAALMQERDGKLCPVSYASRKLLPREQNFSTIERECLAIIWAVQKFHMYLCGRRFVIQTDHRSLSYLNKAKFLNSRIMRWAMVLQQYDFRIESIRGNENVEADYLSRVGF